jgi:8-oxo-dGTP pyrophosphatase MutT (NUDIX family)
VVASPVRVDDVVPLTVKGVCLGDGGRVLLCRNHRDEWELPGGRPQRGEQFPACLRREVLEETGLTVAVKELLSAYPYEVLPGAWVNVITYGCTGHDGRSPKVSAEHAAVAFLDPRELRTLVLADGYQRAIAVWRSRRQPSTRISL